MQINVGLRCDLACHHCHVEAGPNRREAIDRRTADRVLELLERNPNPTDMEVRHGIEGNLCRCTGYQNIVTAVQDAAERMRG